MSTSVRVSVPDQSKTAVSPQTVSSVSVSRWMVCWWMTCGGAAWAAGAATSRGKLSAAVVSRRAAGRIDTVPFLTVARRPAERWSSSGAAGSERAGTPSRQGRRARLLLAGKGAVPAGSATRRPFGPCRCPPPSAVALAWPDDKLRCVCGPKHPRWLQDVLAAGHSSRSSPWVAARARIGPTAPLPGSRTRSPRPSRRRQDR